MDAMLQRHCARYVYVIPDGLRELMSDISREVLRGQPRDVYAFIADYLDALMITRENARVAARLVQSLTELATTTATFLEETGMPRDDIEHIVHAIQKTFQKSIDPDQPPQGPLSVDDEEETIITDIMTEIDVAPHQAEIAAGIIQQAYRRFKERKEREKNLLAGVIDWRAAARSAIRLYRRTGVTNEEANRAATLIKAAYKGYYTRRIMRAKVNAEQYELMKDYSDQPLDFPNYHPEVDEFPDEEYESDDKVKFVKIDYNTVIPHVAFDTKESRIVSPQGQAEIHPSFVSTTSSIVKHSLNYLFDTVAEKVGTKSSMMEEDSSFSGQGTNIVVDFVEPTAPVEMELRQENLDTIAE